MNEKIIFREEIQKLAAKHFTEEKLSFDELVNILGYEDIKE